MSSFDDRYAELVREYTQLRARAAQESEIVQRILSDGLCVVPNFVESQVVNEMRKSLPPVSCCQLSPEGTQTRFYTDANEIVALSPFFDSEVIQDTMAAVLGPTVVRHRAVVQYRTIIGNTGAFEQFFHVDTWLPRYKAFLYLTDVDENRGPFTYTPRTHYGDWRAPVDEQIYNVFHAGADGYIHDDDSAYVGCFWPHEHRALCADLETEAVEVTGSAGTLILFDARGLHRIRPLVQTPRTILYSYWIRNGLHT